MYVELRVSVIANQHIHKLDLTVEHYELEYLNCGEQGPIKFTIIQKTTLWRI